MKKFRSHLFNQVAVLLAISFLCLNLEACNNFLNGDEVKNEIEKVIDYNNAKSLNVMISCPEDMGVVYPGNECTVKLGFDYELQFVLNSNNYYISDLSTIFEAVSAIDRTVRMDDYVEFSAIPRTVDDILRNVYRVNLKVIKDTNILLVRPKCETLPAIESILTHTTTGILYASSPIIVKFNMEMNESKLDFETISLSYNGNDMKDYFYAPVLNEQKDVLIIRPKSRELQNYISNILRSDQIDLKVSFDESITVTKNNVKVPLKQNENSLFTVFYSTDIETTPPVLSDSSEPSFVTGIEIALEDARDLEEDFYFVKNPQKEKLRNYRAKDYIYIYGHYFDLESGVNKVTVYTQRESDDYEDPVEPWEVTEYYVDSSPKFFKVDENGNTYFCIPHEVKGKDGTYYVRYVVADGCEYTAPESEILTFYKETALSGYIDVSNVVEDNSLNHITYNQNLNKLRIEKITGFDIYSDSDTYGINVMGAGKIKYEFGEFPVKISYGDKTVDFYLNNDNPENPYYYYDLDIPAENIPGFSFTVSFTNDIGNEFKESYTIPSEPIVESMEFYYGWPQLISKTGDTYFTPYYYDENNNFRVVPTNKGERLPYQSGTDYYISMLVGKLHGPIRLINDNNQAEADTTTEIQLETPEYEQSEENPREFYITLKVKPDEWDKYSEIFITNDWDFTGKKYFDKTTNSLKFYSIIDYFITDNDTITIFAIKKNGTLVCNSYTIPELNDNQILALDKTTPYMSLKYENELCTFKIREDDTEIKNAAVTFLYNNLNGYSWNKDSPNPGDQSYPTTPEEVHQAASADSYLKMIKKYYYKDKYWLDNYVPCIEITIPVWMIPEGGGLEITAEDTAGNKMKETYFPDFTIYGKIESHGKHNNGIDKYGVRCFQYGSCSSDFKIKKWNDSDKEWVNLQYQGWDLTANAQFPQESNDPQYKEIDFSTMISSKGAGFYKVDSYYGYFIPFIYYQCGVTNTYTGAYDFLISNPGNSKTVLVMSDAPVFVCTYSANYPYENACAWSIDEWEQYKRTTNETVINFGGSYGHELTVHYSDPDNQIPYGYSFVVVVYFADGSKAMSDVFVKN